MSYRKLRRVLQQVVLGLLAIAAFGLAATSAFAQSTADICYIYADHLNTPRAITNNVGQPVLRWDNVDPFGANAPNENPGGLGTFTCNLRFPGQYFDRETGLHYNYFRDYDPTLGRYIQSDPIGLLGGLNSYAYSAGNPLGNADPDGLQSVSNFLFGRRVILCLRAAAEINKFAKQCERDCPGPDDLRGRIEFIEKYTASGQLDAALVGCMCEKAGPQVCGDALAKCTDAVTGKPRPKISR
jgi:RHS repeat-associated protein